MEHKFSEKSYNKAKTMRALIRNQLFEKNRQTSKLAYLSYYDEDTKQTIMKSIEGPIPSALLPANQAVRSTISYYRRSNQFVYKTRLEPYGELDPHMTYESLWSLAKLKEKSECPYIEEVIKQFQRDLPLYFQMPFREIHQVATVAAGNQIIGKPQDIIKIVGNDQNNLWILVNFVYERKISFQILYQYLPKNIQIVYNSIYEITNNYKDEIIYSLINNQQVITTLINAFSCQVPKVQGLAIRIIGNILAQSQDYAGDLTKYHLLNKLYPLLSSKDPTMRRDACWVLANYVYESGPANEVMSKQNIIERLMIMLRNENDSKIKLQMYYVLSNLASFADKATIYQFAMSENILEICSDDLEIQNPALTLQILNLIYRLIQIGQQFIDYEEEQPINQFSHCINNTNLKSQISAKSYNQNQDISSFSLQILEKISGNNDLGML